MNAIELLLDHIENSGKNSFRKFHDAMRARCRSFRWFHQGGTYVRPKNPNEIKGKKNIRAAKRARVRAMKLAQANGQTS